MKKISEVYVGRRKENSTGIVEAGNALDERLGFEILISNLSANFINLPADKIDEECRGHRN